MIGDVSQYTAVLLISFSLSSFLKVKIVRYKDTLVIFISIISRLDETNSCSP